MALSFIEFISSSGISTKREAAIKIIRPPAIITSAEVILAEYDAILSQWESANFYNHPSNDTNGIYYIDKSVLLENTPLVTFIRNYIRDSGGVFSTHYLASEDIHDFTAIKFVS